MFRVPIILSLCIAAFALGAERDRGVATCYVSGKEILGCSMRRPEYDVKARFQARSFGHRVKPGDRIFVAQRKPGSHALTMKTTPWVITSVPYSRVGFSIGPQLFGQRLFVSGHFQIAVAPTIFLGVLPGFARYEQDYARVSAMSTFLTLESYPGGRPFRGLSLLIGAGAYAFRLDYTGLSESLWAPAGIALVGWRFLFADGLHAGFGAGAQAMAWASSELLELKVNGVLPVFRFDFGIAF